MNMANRFKAGAMAALVLAVAACTTQATKQGPGEVRFPDRNRIVLKEGTFPNVANLRSIGPGVTKEQLYHLLGRPHFSEGFAPKAWNYLFHFRTPEGVVTCQYQVQFDDEKRGQSFHWAPASCADVLNPPAATVAPAAVDGVARFSLSADALFAFGRSGVADIKPDGNAELKRIAAEISAAKDSQVTVVGHTDRIGSDASNQRLSQARADTVRGVLVSHGVAAGSIRAEGRGEAEPITRDCADSLARRALVACLAPDRRVEIAVSGSR
jgi:outer membrane protein OmpA-like peptidoglycan-associated protein